MKAALLLLLASLFLAEAKQRFPAKLAPNQGIEPCCPSRRRTWDYGYALLKEAGIYDSAGKPVKQRELGVAGLDLKVGQKYTVKVELVAKKDNPFGSLPKFLGIKLSENYTAADSRAQGAFQASQKKPLLGVHGCSIGQAKADGCEMLTSKFETGCPLENDGDKIELEFPFSAPNLPSAVSMTKFRIIGLEETASSCQSILEPSFNNQVTTTSDLDMICIMYPTIITK